MVISVTDPGRPELSLFLSAAVLGPHRQNTRGTHAGQLYTTPEPGHGKETFLQIVCVYVAG